MAQSGLHGLIGGYVAKAWVKAGDSPAAVEKTKGLKFGLVLGAIIPDVDFFLLGPMFVIPALNKYAVNMHRSFTHSLITTAVVVGLLWLLASGQRRDYRRGLALGLGAGILTHLFFDVLIWFGGIQYLWPLGYIGIPQTLNIWAGLYQPPTVVSNILGALDYLAFGLFYLFLAGAARKAGTSTGFLPRLKLLTVLQWVFTVVYLGLAFVLGKSFDIAHYAAFILIFFPICLYVTSKMKETIWTL